MRSGAAVIATNYKLNTNWSSQNTLVSTGLIRVGIASWFLTFEARPSPFTLGLPELSVFPFPGDLDSNIVYNLHERRTAISDHSAFSRIVSGLSHCELHGQASSRPPDAP
jgi:hypothetical protein